MATYEETIAKARELKAEGRTDDARRLAKIALKMKSGGGGGKTDIMGNVNRGISQAVGGIADFVNPFDQPHALNPFPEGTGSAEAGLSNLMESGGIRVDQGEPDNWIEGMARGGGQAAGAMVPVAGSAGALSRIPGMAGGAARMVQQGMTSVPGATAEVTGGALSGGAMQAAEDAGAPEWAQTAAGVAAPLAIPGAALATGKGALKLPGGRALTQAGRTLAAEAAPFTRAGAQEVAGRRVVELAGGPQRAEELRGRITPDNPLGLTPAQQTGDQNMLALEQLAARDNPELRARLEQRAEASRQSAMDQVQQPGDPQDARTFFEQRRKDYANELRQRAQRAIETTTQGVQGVQNVRPETENSMRVFNALEDSRANAKAQERQLWQAVPMGVTVDTSQSRRALAEWQERLGPVGEKNIPGEAKQWLGEDGLPQNATVRDLHQLYSGMREVAREARAGPAVKERRAAAADSIAEAILDDLGASSGTGEAGQAINNARAYSRAMHEVFDQGAPGKLLQQTRSTEQRVEPELGLRQTVGRGQAPGAVASRQIEEGIAFPSENAQASPEIQDYLKDRFQRATVSGTGEFSNKSASQFLRDNDELMKRYPDLRKDLREAVQARDNADTFAKRVEDRIANLENERLSAGARLINGRPDEAIKAFTNARNPVKEARRLVNEARKDETGKALSGLKSLLSAELVSRSLGNGEKLAQAMENPRLMAGLRQVFSPGELGKMRLIARELSKLDASQSATPDIGESLSGATANTVLMTLARMKAAGIGARAASGGGMGGGIQGANIASNRVRDVMNRLASDRAALLIGDSVEDTELMRFLLSAPASVKNESRALNLLLPYTLGAGAAATTEATE